MILLAATILAFLVGLITGGKLSRLAHVPVRVAWLVVLAFGIQLYLIYNPTDSAPGLFTIHTGALVVSYLFLVIFVWLNRRLPGILILGLGLLMNFAVMIANGGYMPITPEAVIRVGHEHELPSWEPGARLRNTKDILLPAEQTRLRFLSDIFVVPRPFPIPSVFSLGDVFVALGAAIFVITTMHRRKAPAQG